MGRQLRMERVSCLALAFALGIRPAEALAQDPLPKSPRAHDQIRATAAGRPTVAPPGDGAATTLLRPSTAALAEKPIVVTGSRIPRPNLTAVSPVTVVNQQDVKIQGVTHVEEMLNRLPQVSPSQGEFIDNGSSGTATVNLRGLGSARTLVLVNDRRLGPGNPGSQSADLNMIPSFLIQRVDVLTGGASSVYGSDAIAGVVNFILDTKLDGLKLDGQASVFQHDNASHSVLVPLLRQAGIGYPIGNTIDGGRRDINAAVGHKFFGGRAHVTMYAGYREADALTESDRDYSACTLITGNRDLNALQCGGSAVSYPGNFVTNFNVFQIGPGRTFEPGISFYNFAPLNYYQRPDRRYTAGGFADFEMSKAAQLYLEAMYMDDRSVVQIAPSADFGNTYNINCDNPLLSLQQLSQVCFEGNFVGEFPVFNSRGNLLKIIGTPQPFLDPVTGKTYFRGNLQILRRAVESGGRQEDIHHKDLRIVGGLKGDISRGITYDASYVFQRSSLDRTHLNDFSVTRLTRALDVVSSPTTGQPVCRSVLTGEDPNCVPWDVFSLEGASPQSTAYLAEPAYIHGFAEERIANANATIDLARWGIRSPWADDTPQINLGAEHRTDKLDYEPDLLEQSGDLAGNIGTQPPIHGSIGVSELFAETRIPIVNGHLIERLTFEGGYRQSWYTNGGSKFSTNAYKLALDLTVVRGLRFRSSYERAVRAPNLVELFYPQGPSTFGDDPCAGPTPEATAGQCAHTGVTAAQYGQILKLPQVFDGYNAIVGGNPDLRPEIAVTKSVGIVLQPRLLPGLNVTVDWWDIKLQGAIEEIGADDIMATCIATGDRAYCDRIHRDALGSLWLSPQGYIDDRQANIGGFNTRGIDFSVNYTRRLGRFGSFSLEFLGTYLTRWIVANGGLATPYDCTGLYGYQCGIPTPRWRHQARVTLDSRAGVSVSLGWRHIGKMTLADASGRVPNLGFSEHDRILPSYDYFDLSALFRAGHRYVLRLGVNNLFDVEPPVLTSNLGACWSGCNANTYPQWYDPLGRYVFVGATISF